MLGIIKVASALVLFVLFRYACLLRLIDQKVKQDSLYSVFFGYPSVEKFILKNTYMAKSSKFLDKVPSPAITLTTDWKIGVDWDSKGKATSPCLEKYSKAQEVWDCFKNNSFRLDEIIKKENQVGKWKLDLTETWSSVYKTREGSFNWSSDPKISSYRIDLYATNPSISYNMSDTLSVILHDPDYFLINRNPLTVPVMRRPAGFSPPYLYLLYIQITEVKMLNLPQSPCEESTNYSFTKCIKNFVTKVSILVSAKISQSHLMTYLQSVGCLVPWEIKRDVNDELCTTSEQIKLDYAICMHCFSTSVF